MYQQLIIQDTLGDLRLSTEDVHEVIDLWVERLWGTDQTSVADVAEGLDISIEEVQALLEVVYARRRHMEVDIVLTRERLALEQRELAAEQARLRMTERQLSKYRTESSEARHQRHYPPSVSGDGRRRKAIAVHFLGTDDSHQFCHSMVCNPAVVMDERSQRAASFRTCGG